MVTVRSEGPLMLSATSRGARRLKNVVFRSFYLLKRAVGRIDGPPKLDAIVRAGNVQVIFSAHDLCGALARSDSGIQPVAVTPGGELQRERAVRMAVNIAMYVLCSNYKDDQVHAPFLMRRRALTRRDRSWRSVRRPRAAWIIVACALAALGLALLAVELWRRAEERARCAVGQPSAARWPRRPAAGGAAAGGGALPRQLVGPRVVVLVDGSRSVDLPGLDGPAATARTRAGRARQARREVRTARLWFGEGTPVPFAGSGGTSASSRPPRHRRPRPHVALRLGARWRGGARAGRAPAALVVLSDGRLDRPATPGSPSNARGAGRPERAGAPVGLASAAPRDASIRAVRAAGAAVAHQPLLCASRSAARAGCPATRCRWRRASSARTAAGGVASGTAQASAGAATVELSMTLDRAGTRILEIEIDTPSGDEIPDNNKRYVTIDVARDRVRLLHVAGRPTYDVRALRMWLKADASVDLVAFFILRTNSDATQSDSPQPVPVPRRALPQALPSFDAVILQDFDAAPTS